MVGCPAPDGERDRKGRLAVNRPRPSPRENDYISLQMLWFFMVVAVVIYLFVAGFVTRDSIFENQGPVTVIAVALGGFSLVLFGAQLYFRTFLSDERLFPRIRDELDAGPAGPAGFVPLLLQNHATFSTILWAFGEAPAIFGLVLTLLSGEMRYVAGFGLYSLVNLFFFRPRKAAFEEQLTRLRRYMETRPQGIQGGR